jgi:UDP-2,3-diacylglucosamine pyrophosphatase LpxH
MHYKTIVLSDIHLGSKDAHVKEVVYFLKNNTCEILILNGDIVDGWKLKRGAKWKNSYTNFFRLILKKTKSKKEKCDVFWIKGNHDDFLDQIFPLKIGKIRITDHYIHIGADFKKYYVVHGDIFDIVIQKKWLKWLAHVGDVGYSILLWLNRVVNYIRIKQNKPKMSLSLYVKNKVKAAVSYISSFSTELVSLAKKNNCDGVICGHIHHPEIKMIDDIIYMNSGDWVENLSALVEDFSGKWEIVRYTKPKKIKKIKKLSEMYDI